MDGELAFFEHEPWIGKNYGSGLLGLKTAIIGHSHYIDPTAYENGERDPPWLAKHTVWRVNRGIQRIPFFTSISRAFGREPEGFFDDVLFANFIPTTVETRTSNGTREQVRSGLKRLSGIEKYEPDLVVVFSTKVWKELDRSGQEWVRFRDDGPDWIYGTRFGRREIIVTRHPQGAKASLLRDAVQIARGRTRNDE